MSLVAATVNEFGRSIGMSDLRLRDRGAVVLQLESIGVLSIENAGPTRESVVISLARKAHRAAELDWKKLLVGAHYRARLPMPLRLGFVREHVVFSVVMSPEEFTVASLNEAIRLLDQQLSRVEGLA